MINHSTNKIAIFRLGSMGYGMAQSPVRAGHQVHGFGLLPEAMGKATRGLPG